MGAHTTSDDPTKYRSRDETDQWRARDPISRVQTYLLGTGTIDQSWLDELDADSEALAIRVREGCVTLREPRLEELFEHVVIDPPDILLEQRDDYLEYESGFDDHTAADATSAEQSAADVQKAF